MPPQYTSALVDMVKLLSLILLERDQVPLSVPVSVSVKENVSLEDSLRVDVMVNVEVGVGVGGGVMVVVMVMEEDRDRDVVPVEDRLPSDSDIVDVTLLEMVELWLKVPYVRDRDRVLDSVNVDVWLNVA